MIWGVSLSHIRMVKRVKSQQQSFHCDISEVFSSYCKVRAKKDILSRQHKVHWFILGSFLSKYYLKILKYSTSNFDIPDNNLRRKHNWRRARATELVGYSSSSGHFIVELPMALLYFWLSYSCHDVLFCFLL